MLGQASPDWLAALADSFESSRAGQARASFFPAVLQQAMRPIGRETPEVAKQNAKDAVRALPVRLEDRPTSARKVNLSFEGNLH